MAQNDKSKAALTAAGGRALADLAGSVNLDISSAVIKNIRLSEEQNGDTVLLCQKRFSLLGGLNG